MKHKSSTEQVSYSMDSAVASRSLGVIYYAAVLKGSPGD